LFVCLSAELIYHFFKITIQRCSQLKLGQSWKSWGVYKKN